MNSLRLILKIHYNFYSKLIEKNFTYHMKYFVFLVIFKKIYNSKITNKMIITWKVLFRLDHAW